MERKKTTTFMVEPSVLLELKRKRKAFSSEKSLGEYFRKILTTYNGGHREADEIFLTRIKIQIRAFLIGKFSSTPGEVDPEIFRLIETIAELADLACRSVFDALGDWPLALNAAAGAAIENARGAIPCAAAIDLSDLPEILEKSIKVKNKRK